NLNSFSELKMPKYYTYILFPFLALFTFCNTKKEQQADFDDLEIQKTDLNIISNDSNLMEWTAYYRSLDSSFTLTKFRLERVDTVSFIQGNVLGSFNEKFDN